MRYSDVLLMLAEAENEINGPTAVAKDALKTVRNRAFAPEDRAQKVEGYVNALSSKTAFFNAVVNERAWEFGGECIRKFDLIRWGNYGEKVVQTRQALNYMGLAGNEQNLDNPVVARYRNLSPELYYQLNGGMITIMNPRYVAATPDNLVAAADLKDGDGKWAAQSWTKSLVKKVTTDGVTTYDVADYTARTWRGYKDNTGVAPVPYLLPIPYDIVSKSEGVLSNTGYGLVLTNN
jgi:hypothetical protein